MIEFYQWMMIGALVIGSLGLTYTVYKLLQIVSDLKSRVEDLEALEENWGA